MKSTEIFKIINWLDEMEIENYSINPDLTVDVNGNVDLIDKGLTEIPVQFGVVNGYFSCRFNNLTSLQGVPREVIRGWFDCSDNQLTTLKGAPEKVRGEFFCSNNQLTSLEGAPEIVGISFWCRNNKQKFNIEDVKAVCRVELSSIYV